jgi:hypothetical protein
MMQIITAPASRNAEFDLPAYFPGLDRQLKENFNLSLTIAALIV